MHKIKKHEPRVCGFCRVLFTQGGLDKYCSTACQIRDSQRSSQRHLKVARSELPAKWEAFWSRVEDPDYYTGLRRITPQSTLGGGRANDPRRSGYALRAKVGE